MKNSTRAKKLHQVSEHHLIIGVDIGSEKNYARAMNWRGEEYTKKAFCKRNNGRTMTRINLFCRMRLGNY